MPAKPLLLFAALLAAACDGDAAPVSAPDHALLSEVQKQGYHDWARAPGHEARKPTNAPHGRGVEVYTDETMVDALANVDGQGLTEWPEGATIVLEGFAAAKLPEGADPVADRGEPEQIAIMQKRSGTWYWEQYQADDLERPRFAGRPDVCVGCHIGTQDFVRGFSLPKLVEE
jgi:hypothetical protein